MPTSRRKPMNPDLSAILEGLTKAAVEFILVGELAGVVQGAPVTTMNVNILHKRSSENIAKLLAFLQSVDAVHRRFNGKIIRQRRQTYQERATICSRLGLSLWMSWLSLRREKVTKILFITQ